MREKKTTFRECAYCHARFQVQNYNQVFCTPKCRNNYHNDIKAEAIEFYRKHKSGKS